MDWAYGVQVIFVVVITFLVSMAATMKALAMIIFIIASIVKYCVISVETRVVMFLEIIIFQSAKPLEELSLFG